MKVIFELPFKATGDRDLSQFKWLNNSNNWLFILEDGKRLRTISVDSTPPKEIQFANLAEKRLCTSFSWNHDGTLLALVIDEKQIYLWDLKSNRFNHFKPINRDLNRSSSSSSKRGGRVTTMGLVVWSLISNKFVICWSTGQLTICNLTDSSNVSEKFIDNSTGVLRRVVQLEACEHVDLFACITTMFEVMVMSFEGDTKFYIQVDSLIVSKTRFSFPTFSENYSHSQSLRFDDAVRLVTSNLNQSAPSQSTLTSSNPSNHQLYNNSNNNRFQQLTKGLMVHRTTKSQGKSIIIWLSYQSLDGNILLKRIIADSESPEASSKADICFNVFENESHHHYETMNDTSSTITLVDHFWIATNKLICCDSAGRIKLLEIRMLAGNSQLRDVYSPILQEILNIRSESCSSRVNLNPQSTSSSPTQQESTSEMTMKNSTSLKAYDFRFKPLDFDGQKQQTNANVNNKVPRTTQLVNKSIHLSIAALSSHEIFYYELIIGDQWAQSTNDTTDNLSLERIDDIDLSLNLKKFNLSLERVSWSYDCSMLAVQLTGGYMLAYRTVLQNYMLVSCGPKTAQMSGPNEITILDFLYQQDATGQQSSRVSSPSQESHHNQEKSNSNNNTSVDQPAKLNKTPAIQQQNNKAALVINIRMKPSVLAIGPTHVALALNNRVLLYQVADLTHPQKSLLPEARKPIEHEYASIVSGLQLCSNYLAILFQDGRLKLTSIASCVATHNNHSQAQLTDIRERTFPDPGQRLDRISGFILTEKLFLYSTEQRKLRVFHLPDWCALQMLDYSRDPIIGSPIVALRANEQGNKFVCLLNTQIMNHQSAEKASSSNAFLYHLQENRLSPFGTTGMLGLGNKTKFFDGLLRSQLKSSFASKGQQKQWNSLLEWPDGGPHLSNLSQVPKVLNQITDALWDTDGRSVVLIESRLIHNFAILQHCLNEDNDRDNPSNSCNLIIYVASLPKALNHRAVYISQGVVSYQTKLGRMINGILLPHDDDLRLSTLERQIAGLEAKFLHLMGELTSKDDNKRHQSDMSYSETSNLVISLFIDIGRLKLSYLLSILPIYPLSRCMCILEHLATESQFNPATTTTILDVEGSGERVASLTREFLYRVLATWSIYTWNLNFALLTYRRFGLMSHARLLASLLEEQRFANYSSKHLRSLLLEFLEYERDEVVGGG